MVLDRCWGGKNLSNRLLFGKKLQYRSYAYQDDTIFPIDYDFTAEKIQIFDNYQEA